MHNDKIRADVNLPAPINDKSNRVTGIEPVLILLGVIIFGLPALWVVVQLLMILAFVGLGVSSLFSLLF